MIYLRVCLILFVVLFMGKFKGYEPLTFSVVVAADLASFTFLFVVNFMLMTVFFCSILKVLRHLLLKLF